mmetsp:Transcript_10251/g.18733  ORF Transcript_10251/g.18733 Transcript_10251/m.18733 type:complete len:206 (-) Transcript_10251:284-901(-)
MGQSPSMPANASSYYIMCTHVLLYRRWNLVRLFRSDRISDSTSVVLRGILRSTTFLHERWLRGLRCCCCDDYLLLILILGVDDILDWSLRWYRCCCCIVVIVIAIITIFARLLFHLLLSIQCRRLDSGIRLRKSIRIIITIHIISISISIFRSSSIHLIQIGRTRTSIALVRRIAPTPQSNAQSDPQRCRDRQSYCDDGQFLLSR